MLLSLWDKNKRCVLRPYRGRVEKKEKKTGQWTWEAQIGCWLAQGVRLGKSINSVWKMVDPGCGSELSLLFYHILSCECLHFFCLVISVYQSLWNCSWGVTFSMYPVLFFLLVYIHFSEKKSQFLARCNLLGISRQYLLAAAAVLTAPAFTCFHRVNNLIGHQKTKQTTIYSPFVIHKCFFVP